jgi:hypothetical protein
MIAQFWFWKSVLNIEKSSAFFAVLYAREKASGAPPNKKLL